MSEQTASITLHAGDTLTRSDGATAEVLSEEWDRASKKKPAIIGYNMEITEHGETRIALIQLANLEGFLSRWHLQPPETTAVPIGQFFELAPDGQPVPESAPVAAHHDAPSVSPRPEGEGQGVRVDDPDLSATAALIAQLRAQIATLTKRNSFLESRVDGLVESRDSACDQLDAAGSRIETLTEQLAEARAEIAASASPSPLAERGLGGEVLSPPVREFKIMTAISESDLCKMEREGWQIQYMQFNDTALNVVYFRYSPRPEGEGQGVRVSVKPVGPQVTILPDTSRLPGSFRNHMKDVFAEGQRVYNERMAQSPIPAHHPLTSLPAGGSK